MVVAAIVVGCGSGGGRVVVVAFGVVAVIIPKSDKLVLRFTQKISPMLENQNIYPKNIQKKKRHYMVDRKSVV